MKYEHPEIAIILFDASNIITTSTGVADFNGNGFNDGEELFFDGNGIS